MPLRRKSIYVGSLNIVTIMYTVYRHIHALSVVFGGRGLMTPIVGVIVDIFFGGLVGWLDTLW